MTVNYFIFDQSLSKLLYHARKMVQKSSIKLRSVLLMASVWFVEVLFDRVVGISPVLVVDIVPVRVVAIVPVLVVAIVPDFAKLLTDKARTNVVAQMVDVNVFIVSLLVIESGISQVSLEDLRPKPILQADLKTNVNFAFEPLKNHATQSSR